ncbi:hypothetical protein GGX14DRAFT_400544 [Mycena pura]|uniref:Uncharacterized protein n=1 Tax=Mycena pura TaxID=153505 RepID=A0AAD6V5L7_9AGAR|nr:hypothetical protein GGX14DRAFT_400544 [Mycena pura]
MALDAARRCRKLLRTLSAHLRATPFPGHTSSSYALRTPPQTTRLECRVGWRVQHGRPCARPALDAARRKLSSTPSVHVPLCVRTPSPSPTPAARSPPTRRGCRHTRFAMHRPGWSAECAGTVHSKDDVLHGLPPTPAPQLPPRTRPPDPGVPIPSPATRRGSRRCLAHVVPSPGCSPAARASALAHVPPCAGTCASMFGARVQPSPVRPRETNL